MGGYTPADSVVRDGRTKLIMKQVIIHSHNAILVT